MTLAENAPKMMKKQAALPQWIVALFRLLADLPDEEDWSEKMDNASACPEDEKWRDDSLILP